MPQVGSPESRHSFNVRHGATQRREAAFGTSARWRVWLHVEEMQSKPNVDLCLRNGRFGTEVSRRHGIGPAVPRDTFAPVARRRSGGETVQYSNHLPFSSGAAIERHTDWARHVVGHPHELAAVIMKAVTRGTSHQVALRSPC